MSKRELDELGSLPAAQFGRRDLEPMVAVARPFPLTNGSFSYELKVDGVRIVADRSTEKPKLWYRSGRDATRSYPEVTEAVATLAAPCVLDGEVIAFDDLGRPSFERLGQRIGLTRPRDVARAAGLVPVAYVVFDLLMLLGRDTRALPIERRRELLARLIPDTGIVRTLDPHDDDGSELFAMCERVGLEGVIAKRKGSTYRSAVRSDDWVKIKCFKTEDFVVVGYTRGDGASVGALDLSTFEGDKLVVRGKVGSGLSASVVDRFLARVVSRETCAASGDLEKAPRGRTFVEPTQVVSVRFMAWTEADRLRAPVFRGFRDDVPPEACTARPEKTAGPSS